MLNSIKRKVDSLIIFNNLKNDEVINKLYQLCASENGETELRIKYYSDFLSSLLKYNNNFSDYIFEKVMFDENIYTDAVSKNSSTANILMDQLKTELNNIEDISLFNGEDLPAEVKQYFSFKPATCKKDFYSSYIDRIKNIDKIGFGIFSKYNIFVFDEAKKFSPVNSFNIRKLDEMYNYNRERQKIIDNTKALIEGKPTCNVLLYGDAGTGKSSTVKAIANQFKDEGLRLIELKKNQIQSIPDIVQKLSNNPLKFIIFIDDVTFSTEDPDFCALKTILDGDSKGISQNIAVYVTSNHRHLIKESADERRGDLINTVDNIQGILGLSARFGLTITFLKPDKAIYDNIVCNMAKEKNIACDETKLVIRAEAFAIRNGGRTPRTAKQFIDLVYSGVEKID